METETAIVRAEQGAVAPLEQTGDAFLSMLERAAGNPNVDAGKLEKLLDLKVRMESRAAEIEFNQAFARLALKLPRVAKNGTIDLGRGKPIAFAKWEDVDRAIRPILAEEGFSLSFTSKPVPSGVLMTVHLRHIAGHEQTAEMQLPPDKGPGRNDLQAIGSSRQYGKRYLTCDILNIVTEGVDDDGKMAGTITQQQADTIRDMISECGLNKDRIGKLLAIAGVKEVEHIQKHQYEAIMESLRGTLRAKRGGQR